MLSHLEYSATSFRDIKTFLNTFCDLRLAPTQAITKIVLKAI